VTVEELAFYGLFSPGLRSLPPPQRNTTIEKLLKERPELVERYESAIAEARLFRAYYSASGDYDSMPGDPDLYRFFCQRYGQLICDGGMLGVVLPRSAFAALGSEGFRRWLFEENETHRVDFLLNRRNWIFDTHPQYTIALVAAARSRPEDDYRVSIAGTATSLDEWELQTASEGITLPPESFGPGWTVPLLRNQSEADLLAKMRRGSRFPLGAAGRWRCFAVRELDETNDKALWVDQREGWALWKGESFEQYDPHGAGNRSIPMNGAVRKKIEKTRPGKDSLIAHDVPLVGRRQAVVDELGRARVAFRDVSRATDSRTVRACLVPPETLLTNTAPYLAFVSGGDSARTVCLGIMNSLPFDWQARRIVEIHLNFFVLEGLTLPDLDDEDLEVIKKSAATLSCVDERFSEFADSMGVDVGPLEEGEARRLRVEIDARVARAWRLSLDEMTLLLSDFTLDAVPQDYRDALLARLEEFG
jgi:hypothetical protein